MEILNHGTVSPNQNTQTIFEHYINSQTLRPYQIFGNLLLFTLLVLPEHNVGVETLKQNIKTRNCNHPSYFALNASHWECVIGIHNNRHVSNQPIKVSHAMLRRETAYALRRGFVIS